MDLGTRLRYRAAQKLGKNNHRLDLEQPIISFSFDDFPKSAAATGAKLLEERGARGSFYACADFAGRDVNGIQQFDHEDIVGLWQKGHEIGCHTAGHRAVSGLSSEELKGEFDRNERYFKSLGLKNPPTTFAYPFGDVGVLSKRRASQRFNACRGVFAGVNSTTVDLGLLKCVSLEPHILAAKSLDAWINDTARNCGWLILLTHDVSETPSAFGVTPKVIKKSLDLAQKAGLRILPIAAALELVKQGSHADVPH